MGQSAYRKLLATYRMGPLELKNHIVMSPMTRSRAIGEGVPNPLAPTYYAQRASVGLIIAEATTISRQAIGYIRTPGIYTPEQIAGWRKVTDAVHDAGGLIFCQLWHVGWMSHPDFHDGELPVSASALPVEGEVYTAGGPKPMGTPRALETEEIPGVVEQYRQAARNAKAAGFDGAEIHAGICLPDQFLRDGSNIRTDRYGGSIENRARFPLDIAAAVAEVFGADRVGYRISPNMNANSVSDSNPVATFTYLAEALNALGIGYIHITEGVTGPMAPPPEVERLLPHIRKAFKGTLIVNGGYDAASGEKVLEAGEADLVAYGALLVANPDLPDRFAHHAPLNAPDFKTFYTGGDNDENGYTDYPSLAEQTQPH